jgi:Peptidase MA superfamily
VVQGVYEGGSIQTAYISPVSYGSTEKADVRIAAYQRTVQHELTHYAQFDMLTAATAGKIPRWFVEGLASYVGGESERMNSLAADQRSGMKLLSFSDMQSAAQNIYDSQNALLYYEEGYSIFAMLSATKGLPQTTALVVDVTQQDDFETALGKLMGLSPQEFDEQWRQFVSASYAINIPASTGLKTTISQPSLSARAPENAGPSPDWQAASTEVINILNDSGLPSLQNFAAKVVSNCEISYQSVWAEPQSYGHATQELKLTYADPASVAVKKGLYYYEVDVEGLSKMNFVHQHGPIIRNSSVGVALSTLQSFACSKGDVNCKTADAFVEKVTIWVPDLKTADQLADAMRSAVRSCSTTPGDIR